MVGAVLGFSDDSPKAVAAGALSFAGSFVFASAKVLLPVAASACVLLDCVALDFLALSLSNGFSLEIEGEGGVNVLALGAVDAGRAALSFPPPLPLPSLSSSFDGLAGTIALRLAGHHHPSSIALCPDPGNSP